MKKALYILFFLFSFANVFSQVKETNGSPLGPDSTGVYFVTDEMPEFNGGKDALIKFLQENVHLPKGSNGGKSYVKFVIDVDGKVQNAKIIKSSGDLKLDDEALRVIKIMPNWIPGKVKGKPVSTYFNIPINFKV